MSHEDDYMDSNGFVIEEEHLCKPEVLRQNTYIDDKYNEQHPADKDSWFGETADALTAMLGPKFILRPDLAAARNAILTLYIDTIHPGDLSDRVSPVFIDGKEYLPVEEDDVDKKRIQSRIKHIMTYYGLLPYEDLHALDMHAINYWIRVIEDRGMAAAMNWLREQEESGRDPDLIDPEELLQFRALIQQEMDFRMYNKLPRWMQDEKVIIPQDHNIDRAIEQIKRLRSVYPNLVVGMFSGTFDPLHVLHAAQIYHYKQFCHILLLVIDNDIYIENVKKPKREEGRESFDELRRLRDLHKFPHLWDLLMVSPVVEATDQNFIDLIRFIGPDHVFNHPQHEIYDLRSKQIIEAGSKVFNYTPLHIAPFNSTYFWHEILERERRGQS